MNPRTMMIAAAVLAGGTLSAAEREGIAFFERHVRPLLVANCYDCHSQEAEKLRGNLFLDSKEGWERGGDSGGPAIVPGDPDASLLIRSVRHEEIDLEMPPKGPKLSDEEIGHLEAWVRMGAPDPRTGVELEVTRADKSWWSLQPLAGEFEHDTIDGFLEAALEEKGLEMNPPAAPRELIRRMSYNVTGLPPTMAEVEAFEAAFREDEDAAVVALVERLLASPRYGERWGRHWLDVVRFGESNGYERNFLIETLWPFRDYVIRSINDDKPFDRFIIEHLAGDVVGAGDPEVEVGTSFLVAGPYDDVRNQDPVAQANIRAATLDDIIRATSGAFLGLTVDCARCHDHKFDPIPTEDYYRMRSVFEGVRHGERVLATKEERNAREEAAEPLLAERKRLEKRLGALEKALEKRAAVELERREFPRPKVRRRGTEERFEPVLARHVRFTIHAHIGNPETGGRKLAARGAGRAARVAEFEVWTSGEAPRNVARASAGGRAEGARAAKAEDFPDAYGPQFTIDGRIGEDWFAGDPPVLTIRLANEEEIERVVISSTDRNAPTSYTIEVSRDGDSWQQVADSSGREPWSRAHGIARMKSELIRPQEAAEIERLRREIARVRTELEALPKLPEVWAGRFSEPEEPTCVHRGGDPMKPLEAVAPASLAVLDRVTAGYELPLDAPEGERRLALAEWLVAEDNPLGPRVLANRVWHHHFGTGIVDTPSDFGFLGSQPSHPELLDFLAVRLKEHGWRLKPLHREILMSRAYRQSSEFRAEAAAVDGDARLLWRFPPRRLSAEEIRDTMLVVAGEMRLEPMGGPGFRLYKFTQNNVCTYFPLDEHGPETYRRAVYHQSARASVVDLLSDFDFPDVAFATPSRTWTTSPLQSLTLLNHSFTLDMAESLAGRIAEGSPPVARAYRLAYQRDPAADELEAAEAFVADHGLEAFCRALLNSNELLHLD